MKRLTPQEEEKYASYKELTGEQFVEVMQTGECKGYQAKLRKNALKETTIIISKVIVTSKIDIKYKTKFVNAIILRHNLFKFKFTTTYGIFHSFFYIDGSEFRSHISINGGEFLSDFAIFDGTFNSGLYISGGQFVSIRLHGGKHKSNFIISGGSFCTINIGGGEYISNFIVSGGDFIDEFSITGGDFFSDFKVYNGIFCSGSSFIIKSGKFHSDFRINGGSFQAPFNIDGGEFYSDVIVNGGLFYLDFKILGGLFHSGLFLTSISDREIKSPLSINELTIDLDHKDLALNIVKINIHKLIIRNMYSLKTLRIIDIDMTNDSQLILVQNSTLTNTELIGCDWAEATLQVDNSNLMGLFYTDTLFPTKITSSEDSTKNNLEQVRDTYSQLQTVAKKQNDRESSLYFQSKANEHIFQLQKMKLLGTPPKYWNYAAIWKKGWGEFLQLLLNKYSNDFGQSYLRAFVMLFVCTAILFCFYVPSVAPDLVWTWNPLDIPQGLADGFRLYGDNFFYFINPIRKTGFLCPDATCTGAH
ncbi:MAG: hypothetical protein AB8F78_07005 [Saprospiraceae bacterium]